MAESADHLQLRTSERHIDIHLHAGRTATTLLPEDPPGWQRIHPHVQRMPDGRLILTVSRDHDCMDSEQLVYVSRDDGTSWQETTNWPTSRDRGGHLATRCVSLPNGETLALYALALFPTDEPGVYRLPSWRSADSGDTWSDAEVAEVRLPFGEPVDIYDPPAEYLASHPNVERWRKPAPPAALETLFSRFWRQRAIVVISDILALDADRLLAFAYLSPDSTLRHITVCLASQDGGRSWEHRSTPGAWEDRLATENFLTHRPDGLCEPSVVQLDDGELLLVMRLGSRHPLYACSSHDDGQSWSSPRPLPVYGILPTIVRLDDGTLVLASGRPDVSLSFSFDGGYRWPWTHRFIEDGKPEDASTRNVTLLKLGPQRVLHLFDLGGYHRLPENFEGERRIVSHLVDVATLPSCNDAP